DELLAMQGADRDLRRELIEAGELYGAHLPKDWYNPRMRGLHEGNNARLGEILAAQGWPGRALVGEAAGEAAWFIAQHAVLDLDLQRRALALLTAAVDRGEAPAWQMAMLTDRVRMGSGEPQVYGSIHVGGENGELVPYVTEDVENVEARRKAVGLPPLAEKTAELKARVAVEENAQRAGRDAGQQA
ncbi:MAG: DUF6624 domain-containing protein, partial [Anaerolineales bacterium]